MPCYPNGEWLLSQIYAALKGVKMSDMSDKEIYQLIAGELETKNVDAALWTQAKETALGDSDKTEAIYIRLRFLELIKSSRPPQKSTSLVTVVEVKPKVDELSLMRTELAQKLLNQGKYSLYSILKLHPDASDAVIAAAINNLEADNLEDSGVHPAEFKYAKETLGNAELREQYDRQLFESVSNGVVKPYQSYAFEGTGNAYSWWESSKTSVTIGVLLLVVIGYLGVNYLQVQNSSEIQKIAVESQKEVLHTISDAAQMKTQADVGLRAETSRLMSERQNQEMELRSRTADRMNEEQRIMQENRMQAEQQQKQAQKEQAEKWQKTQQDQAESLRVMKEKQYWACMNMQLSQRNVTSYDAGARCAMYR